MGLMVAIMALTAKFGVSGAWSIELIYAQEIYPTMLRYIFQEFPAFKNKPYSIAFSITLKNKSGMFNRVC